MVNWRISCSPFLVILLQVALCWYRPLTRVMAKARPSNLVMHGQYKESVSSQGSGSPVDTGSEYNRTRISLALGNCGGSSSEAEVGSSQVYRHPGLRDTWTDRLNPTKE